MLVCFVISLKFNFNFLVLNSKFHHLVYLILTQLRMYSWYLMFTGCFGLQISEDNHYAIFAVHGGHHGQT